MKTKEIYQTVLFDATTADVYQALLDEKKHSAFTGAAAVIDPEIDGKISVYDGYCHGYNIELIENKKIVQAWHFSEDGWPDDHFSICTFILEPVENKTKLTFIQSEVPEHKADALTSGWQKYYWQPLQEFLKQ